MHYIKIHWATKGLLLENEYLIFTQHRHNHSLRWYVIYIVDHYAVVSEKETCSFFSIQESIQNLLNHLLLFYWSMRYSFYPVQSLIFPSCYFPVKELRIVGDHP